MEVGSAIVLGLIVLGLQFGFPSCDFSKVGRYQLVSNGMLLDTKSGQTWVYKCKNQECAEKFWQKQETEGAWHRE